jgi:hypothetical protein
MRVRYEPSEYIGEAQKHKQRAEKLEKVMPKLRDIESFASGRRPDGGMGDDREWGVSIAHESVAYSVDQSWRLYHRSVAAHIAVDIDYQADKIKLDDGVDYQIFILSESLPAGDLRKRIEDCDYLEIIEEHARTEEMVYEMEIELDQYYDDNLA